MKRKHHQLTCHVKSCMHNANGGCTLQSIAIKPCHDGESGKPEDESMCADYEGSLI